MIRREKRSGRSDVDVTEQRQTDTQMGGAVNHCSV